MDRTLLERTVQQPCKRRKAWRVMNGFRNSLGFKKQKKIYEANPRFLELLGYRHIMNIFFVESMSVVLLRDILDLYIKNKIAPTQSCMHLLNKQKTQVTSHSQISQFVDSCHPSHKFHLSVASKHHVGAPLKDIHWNKQSNLVKKQFNRSTRMKCKRRFIWGTTWHWNNMQDEKSNRILAHVQRITFVLLAVQTPRGGHAPLGLMPHQVKGKMIANSTAP